ncbi:MAG: MnhB domain-containing protein [Acidimicrobiales bacterium]
MTGEYPGQVVRVISVLLAPLIMMFGIYVVAHGHYGPGGGFAGGIIVGVGVILLRITVERSVSYTWFPPAGGPIVAALGVLGFVGTGVASVVTGGQFLDYAATDIPGFTDTDLRYLGILVVEVAVGFAVAGIMVTLFDSLMSTEEVEDA